MANENTQGQEQAFETLMTNVFVPAFVKSCAEHGHPLNSVSEIKTAMESLTRLNAIDANRQAASSNEKLTLMKEANDLLGKEVEYLGLTVESDNTPPVGDASDVLKQALDMLSPTPVPEVDPSAIAEGAEMPIAAGAEKIKGVTDAVIGDPAAATDPAVAA